MDLKKESIRKLREFNRFYLPLFSLLEQKYLGTEYSVAEARILFEIYSSQDCNARWMVDRLHIDKGYLSRILKKFEKSNIIIREQSKSDQRFFILSLTEKGVRITEELISRTNRQIEELLGEAAEEDCLRLIESIDVIIRILGKAEGHENESS